MVNDESPFKDYFSYHERVGAAATENVKQHMEMFQNVRRVEEEKVNV
jgi:fructose-bisphosphate aldolase, class II